MSHHDKVVEFLAKQKQDPNQGDQWVKFEELYEKKLWHQLTVTLLDFIRKDNPSNLLEIYENFVVDFETRIKSLSLVEIIAFVVKQISQYEEKIKFLERIKGKFCLLSLFNLFLILLSF